MADLQIPTSSANETAGSPLPNPSTTNSQSLCDVFINHRGVDVTKSMASLLYHSLGQMGLRVFLDSGEFELGDHIPDKIQHAIRSSSVQIVILSEKYADSPWCLAELALMLETDANIVPVFYDVPPSVPRHCAGSYAEAFRKHELKGRYGKEQIDEWKAALHKASNIKGWELNGHNEDEGQLWKDIVDTVLEKVKRGYPFQVAEHPVGLEEAVGDFNRQRERENNPKLVGIVGMCGSGKTTLAKKLFNVNHSAFDASCFLHDVCKRSAVNNLATLQRIILKRLLNLDLEIDSVIEGKGILKDRFAKVETTSRFLIILDGIDHKEQVDALLVQEVLRTNSLIIITSRDASVFRSCPQAMLYEMKSMAEKHARELFCMHAFNQPSPVIGPENVVDGFMRQCDGLPLLLKEFGALLYGKSEKKELEIDLHNSFKNIKDIKNKLQASYDVFINQRGADVKKSMVSILYHSLRQMGLRVFLDSGEFELRHHIPDVIQHAILSSSVQIAILSENYADSPWCLAELALMLETDAKIVPVFYHVPPSDPRYCLGVYAEAFRKHESDGRYSNAEIKKWKEALHKASNLKGWELNGHNEDEGQLWKDIVDTVLEEVKRRSPLEVAEHPVGLKEAVDDFNRRRERENNPKLVGIVGMCGSGKTTLAAELFNVKRSAFDASCFLHDVCKTSAANNLPTLQRNILKKLLNLDLQIDSVIEGQGILKARFAKVETTSRFLIILDGIDHKDQVDALLVQKVLQTNSLIIITSRDRSVFRSRPQAMLYEMKSMAEKHASELFCRHAFNQPSAVIGSENVVDGFMRQCYGLPLLLKEFGALLNGKSEREWETELDNSFKRLINRDIKNKLQTSYDALEQDEKEMFQDVSCFFIGHPENTAITIWNASGWRGDIGLQNLKSKSLIEVHHGGQLSMHDLFKYLGRDVASDTRLWKSAHINKLKRQGFEHVLRIDRIFRSFLRLPYSHGGRSSEVHFFVGNDHLQFEVSTDLLWLKWENCPHNCIPSWIPMESLRHLEVIDGDLERLWQDNSEGPLELTQLIIQRNPLTVLPMNFGCLRNLLHIDFHGCNQLEKFDLSSFNCLTRLQYLNLNNCESLRLERCNLSFGQHLKTLHLLGTTVDEEVLNQIVKLSSLESLIVGSDSLKSLPSVKELSRLKNLSIRNSEVEHLLEGIGELNNLH